MRDRQCNLKNNQQTLLTQPRRDYKRRARPLFDRMITPVAAVD
ncbi:hypothetical protein [[Phormidium] sp. LEGE 05292]|nr:hypothetical protein [Phormidium sp. LEGE 05292]